MSALKAVSNHDVDGVYPHHGRRYTQDALPDTSKLGTLHADMATLVRAVGFAVAKLDEPVSTVDARQARAVLVDALAQLVSQ